jgi:formylglycine-generating enzyme required for sulfatase activity
MTPSALTLLQELEKDETTAQRRLQIGEALAKLGDPRPGVGVVDGLPDIAWLPVAPGGTVKIMRIWHPETPEEEARVLDTQYYDVAPFYIAKYPVTYAQYQAFIEAEDGFDNLVWWQAMPAAVQRQPLVEQRGQLPNTPRDSLSWYQCMAFAHWLNQRLQGFELPYPGGESVLRVGDNAQVRLPGEWEWQWAAQNGAEIRTYPWGESAPDHANTAETGLEQAIAVGMYPQGAAACGALDMAGNLMEWCANDKDPMDHVDVASDAPKVLRGGDWGFPLDIATCIYVDDETPERFDPLNGFRLVLG